MRPRLEAYGKRRRHDAMKNCPLFPSGMVFATLQEGSHSPAEEASLEDVALGAEVMLEGIKIRRETA